MTGHTVKAITAFQKQKVKMSFAWCYSTDTDHSEMIMITCIAYINLDNIRNVKSAFSPLPDSGHAWLGHAADKVGSATLLEC